MLFKFLLKRVAIAAGILAAIAFFIDGFSPVIAIGLLLGSGASLYKVRLQKLFLSACADDGSPKAKNIVKQIFSQILVFVLLGASAYANWRLFAGVAAGLLLVSLVIGVNAITEYAGLTRNHWGEKQL